MWFQFKPYVSVAQRRAQAMREVAKRTKKGATLSPVKIEGRKISTTFWGKAWCANLEAYHDYANRLPRGASYVRNGSVIDLQISPSTITALVSGSEVYEIKITIKQLSKDQWSSIKTRCAGQIGSLIELLQGKLSKHVLDIVTQAKDGLFPKPAEIKMECNCPDYAGMCKHLAAVMYGVGARLDSQPELLFKLRQVDHLELIQGANSPSLTASKSQAPKILANDSALGDIFGIEMSPESDAPQAKNKPARATRAVKVPKAAVKAKAIAPKAAAASKAVVAKPKSVKAGTKAKAPAEKTLAQSSVAKLKSASKLPAAKKTAVKRSK